jgi:16S rRNA (guanine527-N7)-methyltransferase
VNAEAFQRRLTARAARSYLTLTSRELDQLWVYYELLSRWNRRINLTGLQLDPLDDSSLDRLLIEPLAAARHVPDSPFDWFDLGSGGGSPAVPLRVRRPRARLTMVEARARKGSFLRAVVRELRFDNVNVLTARFEDLKTLVDAGSNIELVTARAVRIDQLFLRTTHDLLASGGQLLLFGAQRFDSSSRVPFTTVDTVELLADTQSTLTILRK